jgi:hypothetical protein
VLSQALERNRFQVCARLPGHDHYGWEDICAYIGIVIVGVRPMGTYGIVDPPLPRLDSAWHTGSWPEWAPHKRHTLPEYVPDIEAGKPSPLRLTKWEIGAIKIAVTLEQHGFVTRHDLKTHGIDHRRWTKGAGWLLLNAAGYVAGPRLPDFKAQYPRVYDEIEADAAKWMPSLPLMQSKAA